MTDLFNQQLDSFTHGTRHVWYRKSRVSKYNGNRKAAFDDLLSLFTYANEHDPAIKIKRTASELHMAVEDIVDGKIKCDLLTETSVMMTIDPNKEIVTQREKIESQFNFICWLDLKFVLENMPRKRLLSID